MRHCVTILLAGRRACLRACLRAGVGTTACPPLHASKQASAAPGVDSSSTSTSTTAFLLNTKPLAFIRPSTIITMPPKRKASSRTVTTVASATDSAVAAPAASSSSPSPSKSNKKAKN